MSESKKNKYFRPAGDLTKKDRSDYLHPARKDLRFPNENESTENGNSNELPGDSTTISIKGEER